MVVESTPPPPKKKPPRNDFGYFSVKLRILEIKKLGSRNANHLFGRSRRSTAVGHGPAAWIIFFFTAVHIWQKWRCAFFCRFSFAMIEKGGGLFLLHKKGDGKLHWYYSNQPFCLRRKRLQFFLDKYLEASVRRNFLKKVCWKPSIHFWGFELIL